MKRPLLYGGLFTVGLVIVLAVLWIRGYRILFFTSTLFEGDGQLIDRGAFSLRPRYVVTFPEIGLAQSARYDFQCKGLPWETMTFLLKVVDRAGETLTPDRNLLEEQALIKRKIGHVNVQFQLTDGTHKTIRAVKAPLKDWLLFHNWCEASFYVRETYDIPFKPDVAYTFTIIVDGVNGTELIRLEPRLQGGGLETP